MKKVTILAASILLFSLGACSVKTCPTYSKKDVKEITVDQERV